jgi:hypothetical protein
LNRNATELVSPSAPPCLPKVERRSEAVLGERLDDNGDAARPVTFVAHFLVIGAAVGAGGFLDRALDGVARHVDLARGGDRGAQPRIGGGVGQALAGGDGDLADRPAEQARALGVARALAVHDVLELRMPGHGRRS